VLRCHDASPLQAHQLEHEDSRVLVEVHRLLRQSRGEGDVPCHFGVLPDRQEVPVLTIGEVGLVLFGDTPLNLDQRSPEGVVTGEAVKAEVIVLTLSGQLVDEALGGVGVDVGLVHFVLLKDCFLYFVI